MGTIAKDPIAKAERGYREAKSVVYVDGREKLVKRDWEARKRELLNRSGGRCERVTILGKSHDAWCRGEGGEPHHICKRSQVRDDRITNLCNLSHWCHLAEDERKVRWTKRSPAGRGPQHEGD